MKKKIIVVLSSILLIAQLVMAQFTFSFVPDVYGRTVDGLSVFQVINATGKTISGQVLITVKEATKKIPVVTIRTAATTFVTGTSSFPKNIFAGSQFMFSGNSYGSIASQTRNFPPGQYVFCYALLNSDKTSQDDFENCFDAEISPLVPLTLISPGDRDKICQKRPPLSWQPPIPFNASMRFRLLLTEKKAGESVENLLVNSPLILLDNITSTTISYPSNYPDLQEGKTYCWQVIAYQQGVVMSRSEIWEFTVQCTEPSKPAPFDSYRELKSLVNGNYYIANRILKFSFQNPYNVKKLIYEIRDLSNGMKKIKDLPEVAIVPGLNKIDIDLVDLGLNPGGHYILKVYPFNEQPVEVRFVYQDNETTN
ncbi:MAG: hypothetical protein QM731_24935 [Chitinophagaceae bacterium]